LLLLPVPFLIDEIVALNLLYYGEKRIKRIQLIGSPVDAVLLPDVTCSICQFKFEDSEETEENFCINVPSHVMHSSCLLPWWLRIGPANANCPECRGSLHLRIRVRPLGETENFSLIEEVKDWLIQAKKRVVYYRYEILTRAARITFWGSVIWIWIIAIYIRRTIKRKQ
jgi:hypothetical protein